MGFHLNYELRLPSSVSRADAAKLLAALRDIVLAKPVDYVSPLVDLAADAFEISDDKREGARECIEQYARILGDPVRDDEWPHYTGDPASALGFMVQPGERCETATFGLMWRTAEVGDHEEWFWWCGCKTQYASVISDEHLIKVHTTLVEILDAAASLGFDVVVRDETGYWESRSVDVLLERVAHMNRIVAKFAGAFSDAIEGKVSVESPIFEHRNFEGLEMGEVDRSEE